MQPGGGGGRRDGRAFDRRKSAMATANKATVLRSAVPTLGSTRSCHQLIPAVCMSAILYLKLGMLYALPARTWVARVLYMLKPWSMVDIFLMGLIISFVKLVADADISLGPSFWAFCLFCLLHLRAFQVIDRRELWSKIAPCPAPEVRARAGRTGLSQQLKLCKVCTAMVPVAQKHCSRCHSCCWHVALQASARHTLRIGAKLDSCGSVGVCLASRI